MMKKSLFPPAPGTLVRFRDVSSFADRGHGSFENLDGTTAVVVKHFVDVDGIDMLSVLMDGKIQQFSPLFFQEVLNESR